MDLESSLEGEEMDLESSPKGEGLLFRPPKSHAQKKRDPEAFRATRA